MICMCESVYEVYLYIYVCEGEMQCGVNIQIGLQLVIVARSDLRSALMDRRTHGQLKQVNYNWKRRERIG